MRLKAGRSVVMVGAQAFQPASGSLGWKSARRAPGYRYPSCCHRSAFRRILAELCIVIHESVCYAARQQVKSHRTLITSGGGTGPAKPGNLPLNGDGAN